MSRAASCVATSGYGVAGLAAAVVDGAQIGGGLLVPRLGRIVHRRTSVLVAAVSTTTLTLIGTSRQFAVAALLLVLWGLMFAVIGRRSTD